MKKLIFLLAVAAAGFFAYRHLDWGRCFSKEASLEQQIRMEREKLPELDVEIRKLISQVAAREVELKQLDRDIAETEKHLKNARQTMIDRNAELTNNATLVKVESKNNSDRERALRELNRLADTVERLEAMLRARTEQREAFKEALHAAHEELVAYQNEQRALETELAQLDALVAQVRTEEVKSRIHFDKSKLAERTRRIEELRTQAEIRQKERELNVKYLGSTNQTQPTVAEKDVLERVKKLSGK